MTMKKLLKLYFRGKERLMVAPTGKGKGMSSSDFAKVKKLLAETPTQPPSKGAGK